MEGPRRVAFALEEVTVRSLPDVRRIPDPAHFNLASHLMAARAL